jgi:methylglutaconyl-CoA hydratase
MGRELLANTTFHGNSALNKPMHNFIKTEFVNGVGRLILNRPEKRNALTRDMLDQFCQSIDQLQRHDNLRVLIVQAAGSVFCAGMDLAQMQARSHDPGREEQWRADSESYYNAIVSLLDCQIPTIAALPGPAIAGGLGLALACDIVIAADSAVFALPEPKRGIVAAMVTPLLLRRTSPSRAGYVLLAGQSIPAAQALTMGLCDVVVDGADIETTINNMVESVLEGSPQALAMTKQFLYSIGNIGLREALDRAIQVSADARWTTDAREGLGAFLEKRKPAWVPRDKTK